MVRYRNLPTSFFNRNYIAGALLAFVAVSSHASMPIESPAAEPTNNVELGRRSLVFRGGRDVAVGDNAYTANADRSVAIGNKANVGPAHLLTGERIESGIAIGDNTTVTKTGGVALGRGAVVSGLNSIAIGPESQATAQDSVALGAGSIADRENTVSVGRVGKTRQITNVSAGTRDTDAVNVAQLKNAGVMDSNGNMRDALVYDAGKNGGVVTLGGVGATSSVSLTNVAAGRIAAGSTDVVNGGQLFALTSRVEKLEDGRSPPDRRNDSKPSPTPTPTPNHDAQPNRALDGAGQRVTNIGDGVQNNDAVNIGQLNAAVEKNLQNARAYTDQMISGVEKDIDHNKKLAAGGTSTAIAIANLPQAMPGHSMVSVAGGTFGGQAAAAIGVSTSMNNWTVKASFAGNSQKTYGGGVGVGYSF